MRLRDQVRAWVGSRVVLLGIRIMGEISLREMRTVDDDDAEPDELVYPAVKLGEQAERMIVQPESRASEVTRPKPLKGSLADRWSR